VPPTVVALLRAGKTRVVVPAANAAEAALILGVDIRGTDTLHRLVGFVLGRERLLPPRVPDRYARWTVRSVRCGGAADGAQGARGRRHHLAMVGRRVPA
jgi:magnesium chelatase family protein